MADGGEGTAELCTAELSTAEDTLAFGARLGEGLRAGDVVVLAGPLGAGKTVLAKGIARALNVAGAVTSPTFVLARVHPAVRAGAPAMVHVDVYRLLDHPGADLLAELDSLDLDTDLEDAVVVVEWGEGLAERLSERHLDIRLERGRDTDVRIATWQWSVGASEATGDVVGASEATGDVVGASEATGDVAGASEATGQVAR